MFVRLYHSAVDPSDVDEFRQLFRDDVEPAFEQVAGCRSIELMINTEGNAGGLVEGCTLSYWDDMESIERAFESRPLQESLVRIRGLLRQEPVVTVYEIL